MSRKRKRTRCDVRGCTKQKQPESGATATSTTARTCCHQKGPATSYIPQTCDRRPEGQWACTGKAPASHSHWPTLPAHFCRFLQPASRPGRAASCNHAPCRQRPTADNPASPAPAEPRNVPPTPLYQQITGRARCAAEAPHEASRRHRQGFSTPAQPVPRQARCTFSKTQTRGHPRTTATFVPGQPAAAQSPKRSPPAAASAARHRRETGKREWTGSPSSGQTPWRRDERYSAAAAEK